MKRIVPFLIMLICVCALPSCEELCLDELFQTESSSLSGTQWQHIEYNTPAGTVHSTLSFSSSTFSLSIKQSKGTNQSYSGKYEYSGGSGTLYIDGDPAYISVSGYDLTLSWTGVRLDFTKKCGVIPYNDCGSGGGSAKVYDTKNKKWIN